MKIKIFVLFLISIFYLTAACQLTKGHWLDGGAGSFSSTTNTYSSSNYFQSSDVPDIKISPNIGYFFIDKFAIGLRPGFSKNKAEVTTTGGLSTNVNRYEIGPFVRYFFLKDEESYNILVDASYQFGIYRFKPDKGDINIISAMAGPVIYFNSVVGLEFLVGYYKRNEDVNGSFKTKQKGFQIIVGFQIHLEKG
jgi:hypothetical protein